MPSKRQGRKLGGQDTGYSRIGLCRGGQSLGQGGAKEVNGCERYYRDSKPSLQGLEGWRLPAPVDQAQLCIGWKAWPSFIGS